jgi:hypothetical protein
MCVFVCVIFIFFLSFFILAIHVQGLIFSLEMMFLIGIISIIIFHQHFNYILQ